MIRRVLRDEAPEREIELLAKLADPGERREAARLLARRLGAEDLIVFVKDLELDVLLPAPGFPQTLPEGKAWKALLERCAREGSATGEILSPEGKGTVPVLARAASDGTVLALLGGESASLADAEDVCAALPLLAAALRGEQSSLVAASQADSARQTAVHSRAAMAALDATRGDLQRTLGKVKEMDRRKDEFLAMLGHELRNPLAPILTSLELLRPDLPEKAEHARAVIERNARHMARLIDDLLDVARISRGQIVLRREPVALSQIVELAVEIAHPLIESRAHELSVSLPAESLWLDADPSRLGQVLSNLLNNAAKFTIRGGRIALTAERTGNLVSVEVSDNGMGISPEMLPRIFDLFAQGQSSLERSEGGLGIGLTLARQLVEMHGGSLTAESGGPGQGSRFRIALPAFEATAALPQVALPAVRGAEVEQKALSGDGRRVLVVDDSADAAAGLAELLGEWGYDVRTASDGPSAIETAVAYRPEVILLDIGLPKMDGFEVARRLRAEPRLRKVVLIALTGYGQESDRRQSREAGFHHHLLKPVDFATLESLLIASGKEEEAFGKS